MRRLLHPIAWYKATTIWWITLFSHVPGYRKYCKFWLRHYERDFWMTHIVATLVGWTIGFAGLKLTKKGLQMWRATDWREIPIPSDDLAAVYTDSSGESFYIYRPTSEDELFLLERYDVNGNLAGSGEAHTWALRDDGHLVAYNATQDHTWTSDHPMVEGP